MDAANEGTLTGGRAGYQIFQPMLFRIVSLEKAEWLRAYPDAGIFSADFVAFFAVPHSASAKNRRVCQKI